MEMYICWNRFIPGLKRLEFKKFVIGPTNLGRMKNCEFKKIWIRCFSRLTASRKIKSLEFKTQTQIYVQPNKENSDLLKEK